MEESILGGWRVAEGYRMGSGKESNGAFRKEKAEGEETGGSRLALLAVPLRCLHPTTTSAHLSVDPRRKTLPTAADQCREGSTHTGTRWKTLCCDRSKDAMKRTRGDGGRET